ncbi:MAG: hypothetical protein AABW46_00540 [Nanoarchaeota archaeon]
MKKRGQIFGEPFIFIFALIVAAMVFAFGIKIFFDIQERAEFAQVADTVQRINEQITTFYNLEQGSNNVLKYNFPSSVDCICFLQQTTSSFQLTGNCDNDLLENNIRNGNNNMVFWLFNEKTRKKEAKLPDKLKIKGLFTVTDNTRLLCFDLVKDKHTLQIRLESQGNQVLITRV